MSSRHEECLIGSFCEAVCARMVGGGVTKCDAEVRGKGFDTKSDPRSEIMESGSP